MVVESGRRHAHDITVDALHTGLQQKDFDPGILGQPTGKNTAGRACPNCKTTVSGITRMIRVLLIL